MHDIFLLGRHQAHVGHVLRRSKGMMLGVHVGFVVRQQECLDWAAVILDTDPGIVGLIATCLFLRPNPAWILLEVFQHQRQTIYKHELFREAAQAIYCSG